MQFHMDYFSNRYLFEILKITPTYSHHIRITTKREKKIILPKVQYFSTGQDLNFECLSTTSLQHCTAG